MRHFRISCFHTCDGRIPLLNSRAKRGNSLAWGSEVKFQTFSLIKYGKIPVFFSQFPLFSSSQGVHTVTNARSPVLSKSQAVQTVTDTHSHCSLVLSGSQAVQMMTDAYSLIPKSSLVLRYSKVDQNMTECKLPWVRVTPGSQSRHIHGEVVSQEEPSSPCVPIAGGVGL